MRKMHKQYINEWKSVNDNVISLSNRIASELWGNSQDDEPHLSRMANMPYIEGSFNTSAGEVGVDSITVYYVLYMAYDEDAYNELISKKILGAEYDIDKNMLSIISCIVNGVFHNTLVSDIYHEVEHVFQYSSGMEKRENLYDDVVSFIRSDNNNETLESVARLIYMTFPHEQDAFANQFYGYLRSNNVFGMFRDIVNTVSEYRNLNYLIGVVKLHVGEEYYNIAELLKGFGMTFEQFKKRVHYGKRRLYRKLRKVYQRHMIEMRERRKIPMETENILSNDDFLLLLEHKDIYGDISYKNEDYLIV